MKKLYVIRAGQDYGSRQIIRAYVSERRAEAFATECREYAASRPAAPRPQNHDDPDDEARHDADCELWFKALDKWEKAHPATGYHCEMDYRFDVGTVDFDDEE